MTPPELARAIVAQVARVLVLPDEPVILEPGAGQGAFVAAARERWPNARILAVDVEEGDREACLRAGADRFICSSYLEAEDLGGARGQADLAIGNPPYSLVEEFVRKSWRDAAATCFLLRAAFRAGAARWRPGGLHSEYPPRVSWPVVPRPSFTGGGTEHMEYEAFAWSQQSLLQSRVQPIVWR